MRPPRLLPLAVALPLLAGCSGAVDTATRARDCVALARDVASSGLAQTPTPAEAEQAAERLRERAEQVDTPEVRDAAQELQGRLEDLARAARDSDPAAVRQAAQEARESAESAAETCGLPVRQFLG